MVGVCESHHGLPDEMKKQGHLLNKDGGKNKYGTLFGYCGITCKSKDN